MARSKRKRNKHDAEERHFVDPNTQVVFSTNSGTNSGVDVNPYSALNYSAVFAAIRLISTDVSALPIHVVRVNKNGDKERQQGHPIEALMKKPNPLMLKIPFIQTLLGHALAFGNGYAEIIRDRAFNAVALMPRRPDRIRVEIQNDSKVYRWNNSNGTEIIPEYNMIHIHNFSYDGYQGIGVIELARQTIGAGIAMERYGGAFFGNSAAPSGILSVPGSMKDQTRKNLRESWERTYSGPDNSHKVAVLEQGLTWQAIGMGNEDAQFLQSREFNIREIGLWFGVSPQKLGDMSKMTFNNFEQSQIEYRQTAILPWTRILAAEIEDKILSDEDEDLQVRFKVDSIHEADTASRYAIHAQGIQAGFIMVNEARRKEDLKPIEGGDTPSIPVSNMSPKAPGSTPTDAKPDPPDKTGEEAESNSIDFEGIFAPLLKDAITRCNAVEATQVNKRIKAYDTAEGFSESVKDLYSKYRAKIRGFLATPLEAFAEATGTAVDVDAVVDDYISKSRGQLIGASKTDAPVASLQGIIKAWEEDKPAAMASRIIEGVKDD